MEKHGLSGLAVVNSNQEIVHNTSSTDIKLWLQSHAALGMTIEDFLVKIRSEQIQEKKSSGFSVTYATADSTLKAVVDMLMKTKYHRIWVVDDAKRPVGVISLTDIFKFITNDFKPLFVTQSTPTSQTVNEDEEET
ncbi:hypothetical protein RFI_06345 [Reticulomyxa filosa]|uniref:CBS domain-containing protein n=1 Tax=Reticulomyxa filosa TaxID=46433 RepID=X6NWS9_RETFI|nr:hypothetical protein RFI_06345 [Reticulomyxa filosa]|eukprot:ETO30775.1 hypothetical protein RFI_06345 [Reticulomyxa filosa]